MDPTIFFQHDYRCRFDWGRGGTQRAADRGDIVVIVDTLSFSSAVATAVHYGAMIYPCSKDDDLASLHAHYDAEVAVHRTEVPTKGRFSLSPLTYIGIDPGTSIILASPNGATCSRYGREVPYLFVGALNNAKAIAAAVASLLKATDLCVTVIACGERWEMPSEDGAIRFAVEDYLGAGAILSYLLHEKSSEARVCEQAFIGLRGDLQQIIWECSSGRELRAICFGDDVLHAAKLDIYDSVPVMSPTGWITDQGSLR